MSRTSFWKPEPREPWSDWRMFSMLVPILVSAVGFFVTGIFAFAFSDIAVIPRATQSWMVIVGSALIVFGAELNTPFTTIEVFRKILRQEANSWDISALIVSLIGTVVNLLVTFASRLSLDTAWKGFVLNWGPLLAGFAVACDYYGALVELGFLFGSFEMRMESWLEERRVWEEARTDGGQPAKRAQTKGLESGRPVARIKDFRRVLGRLNGERATLTTDKLAAELAQDDLELPTPKTVKRWLKQARN